MKKSMAPVVIVLLLILLVVAAGGVTMLVKRYTPTATTLDSNEYFNIQGEGETALVVNGELLEDKGVEVDGKIYIDCTTVGNYINGRFYWDSNEEKMIITLPEEKIVFEPDSSTYWQGGVEKQAEEVLLKNIENKDYLALDFVGQYTDMSWKIYENPDRVVIQTRWDNLQCVTAQKDAEIRQKGGIKSPILTTVPQGTTLYFRENLEDWYEVYTEDGYRGYVQAKKVSEPEEYQGEPVKVVPEYTSISKDYPINLVWHQVTSQAGNATLEEMTAEMTGVNTISPTWFSIQSSDGTLMSLANADYVQQAHAKGLEVWALIDNFNKEVSTLDVLSYTSKREYIIQQLMDAANTYGFDGINVDFESIQEEEAPHYIQFIRELSIECRKAGLVLSVDNPVPKSFNTYYDRREQGIVADYVIIMGYDEHYSGSSEAGSVASLPFVEEGIQATLEEVPKEKVINGIPFYTRLWKKPYGSSELFSEVMSMDESQQFIQEQEANGMMSYWDEKMGQTVAEMQGEDALYQIWVEDEQSIEAKMKLIKEYDLAGVAAWKLGFERASVWSIISEYLQ